VSKCAYAARFKAAVPAWGKRGGGGVGADLAFNKINSKLEK